MSRAYDPAWTNPSRRGVFAGVAGLALAGPALAAPSGSPPKPHNVVSPDEALKRLMTGNEHYVKGLVSRHDFTRERAALAGGQNPFASILGCADSRVAPEYLFDVGRGDIFVCRVAGNFANDDVVASLEYSVAVLGAPLIMVLGHGACGAISATIKSLDTGETLPGHLPSLVNNLAPAVKAARGEHGHLIDNAIRENVVMTAAKLRTAHPILKAAVDSGKLRVVGGVYHLADGRVELVA
jgi:carbonic anhydrase